MEPKEKDLLLSTEFNNKQNSSNIINKNNSSIHHDDEISDKSISINELNVQRQQQEQITPPATTDTAVHTVNINRKQKKLSNFKGDDDNDEYKYDDTNSTNGKSTEINDETIKLLPSTIETNNPSPPRRFDEPSELSFVKKPENYEEQAKRQEIERALQTNSSSGPDFWKHFAKTEYGLVNDDLRRQVWHRLLNIDANSVTKVPKLEELKNHPEYNQVILDVNRSLKRFPPGIPYEQRIALQDQLTVLILRVIMKYPHLKYYQGYHDVAITILLVVGEEIAFHIMEVLSTEHLVECMQETMEPTQRRLLYLFPIIINENPKLGDYLEKSTVGTMFALPWFLTWFGHSLNSYRDVVRLYDYFLASDHLLPIYVTAAIVLYRESDIFSEDCEMASIHHMLSQLPDNLPFEYLLNLADELYEKYSPDQMEKEVQELLVRQEQQRKLDDEKYAKRRQLMLQRKAAAAAAAEAAIASAASNSIFRKFIPNSLLTQRSALVTTAFSIIVGICAYYYKTHLVSSGIS